MDQITFFIIGIVLLVTIPLTYFCFVKIISKKTSKFVSAVLACVFVAFIAIILVLAMNVHAFLINTNDSVVCERYLTSLVKNSANSNFEKHITDTEYISYPDIADLQSTFAKTAKFDIDKLDSIFVSILRFTDDEEGFTHLYMYLDSYDVCYDFGMIPLNKFWDIASVEILSDSELKDVMQNVKFVKLK